MILNKPSGNMYSWAYTCNPVGGCCLHKCKYCYVDDLPFGLKEQKYSSKSFLVKKPWGSWEVPDPFVLFVCSCNDLFGSWIPDKWISKIVDYASCFPETTFLFQTKNPERVLKFWIPMKSVIPKLIIGTTLESDIIYSDISFAPNVIDRFNNILKLKKFGFRIMISIEPIMNFDPIFWLMDFRVLKPEFVSIGADSGNHGLPEPNPEKIKMLIEGLEKFTEVRIKKNLERLINS